MFKPSHWGQLAQIKSQPTLSESSIPSRKIIAGKVKPSKRELDRDRSNYCRIAAYWLDEALCESAAGLDDLWGRGAISTEIADLIRRIFRIACSTVDDSLKPTRVGSPPTLRKAKNLLKEMAAFRDAIDAFITYDQRHALELAWCLHEFCCDIAHYELQIRFAYGIVHVDAGGRFKPANRPTNLQGKVEFAKIVNEYQAAHGAETFPKPRQIKAALDRANHSVPDRTLREWRKQMRLNTFSQHIQPRKRQ
jgi:hypothetical protein